MKDKVVQVKAVTVVVHQAVVKKQKKRKKKTRTEAERFLVVTNFG